MLDFEVEICFKQICYDFEVKNSAAFLGRSEYKLDANRIITNGKKLISTSRIVTV